MVISLHWLSSTKDSIVQDIYHQHQTNCIGKREQSNFHKLWWWWLQYEMISREIISVNQLISNTAGSRWSHHHHHHHQPLRGLLRPNFSSNWWLISHPSYQASLADHASGGKTDQIQINIALLSTFFFYNYKLPNANSKWMTVDCIISKLIR